MVRYLTLEEVVSIHAIMIKRYGGHAGVRDLGLIQAAVARPQSGFGDREAYPDIFTKAAVLLHSLIQNHGFSDGNKRTGITACGVFLILNGYELAANQVEMIEITLSVAEKKAEAEIAEWLRRHTHAIT